MISSSVRADHDAARARAIAATHDLGAAAVRERQPWPSSPSSFGAQHDVGGRVVGVRVHGVGAAPVAEVGNRTS